MEDPVCGMQVEEHEAACVDWQGRHYCFCSEECRREFERQPQKYAKQETA